MTAGPPSRVREAADAFGELVELPPGEIAARLRVLEAADPALAGLVREMLEADGGAGAFLEGGAAEYSPRLGSPLEETTPECDGAVGQAVGPYVLASLLGRGGMGEVWVADRRDGQFEQRVALKLLRKGIDSEGIRRRFVQERQLLARLDHPNIARLLDGGTADGRPFFVLELVEGEPITEFARARGLSVEQRLLLVATCCDAVDAAHRRLVVHRDIKPSNVLVTKEGQVKLLDFGIAKVLSADGDGAEYTQVDERVLTPSYAAPEQILGQPVTTATDVYSLGVLLYRLLTGVLPHAREAASAAGLASAVERETVEKPSRAAAHPHRVKAGLPAHEEARLPALIADDLDAIILKALRREPDRRYPGAASLGGDLRRHLAGLRVEARPDTFSYRTGKFIRRHRAGVAAGVLTLLALLAGLAGTTWEARRAQANARRAERVQEFLVRLFEGSDPNQSRGENISARDLLADGTRRIEGELRGEPEIQAALYDVVAQIHRSLGSLPEAQRLAEHSLSERRRIYGDDSPLTAASRLTLAETRYSKGEVEAAESELRALLPTLAATYGADAMETIRARDTIAAALLDEGKVAPALAMMQESVASRRRRFGPDHPETGRGRLLLGQMQEASNHYAEAAAAYQAAVDTLSRALGPDNPQTAGARCSLAQALAYMGKREEGEKQFREALAAQRKSLGDRHPETGQTLLSLGLLLVNERRYAEADAALTEALGIFQPLGHFDAGSCLRMLGMSLTAQERYEEAARRFEEALVVLREKRGPKDQLTLTALGNLGNVYLRMGQLDGAESRLRESVAGLEAIFGPEADQLRAPLNQLGEVLCLRGLPDQAAALHRRALGIQLKSVGSESPSVAGTRYLLALDLLAEGGAANLVEARGLLDAAMAVQRKADADHPRLDDMLLASGRVARAQSDRARAGRDLTEAADRYERHRGAADPRAREARRLSAAR
jgi:serine/threonine-protein kinase